MAARAARDAPGAAARACHQRRLSLPFKDCALTPSPPRRATWSTNRRDPQLASGRTRMTARNASQLAAVEKSAPEAATCPATEVLANADDAARRNQLRAFLVTGGFLVLSLAAFAVNELYVYLIAYIWFGFIYGMSLQYGRFCFSSAFRDLFAVGVPRMLVGIVIATVLFGVTASFVTAAGMSAF